MKTSKVNENALSHDKLLELLEYSPDSGVFSYKVSRGPKAKGSRAGYLHHSNYRYIEINGKVYSEHRLAWFYCFKEWPDDQIDHIDRNTTNNCLDNLREATPTENMRNRSIGINNTSGYLGVSPYNNKWKASYASKHLGYFDTPEQASEAYKTYKDSL